MRIFLVDSIRYSELIKSDLLRSEPSAPNIYRSSRIGPLRPLARLLLRPEQDGRRAFLEAANLMAVERWRLLRIGIFGPRFKMLGPPGTQNARVLKGHLSDPAV